VLIAGNLISNLMIHELLFIERLYCVGMLLDRGAEVDARTTKHSTPLHIAAQYGSLPMVSLFLSRGASISATQKFAWTPLHHASAGGHVGVAALLLDKGAAIDARKVLSFHQYTLDTTLLFLYFSGVTRLEVLQVFI